MEANPELEKLYGEELRYTRKLLAKGKVRDGEVGRLVAYIQKASSPNFWYFFSPLGYDLAAYQLLREHKEALADLIYEMGLVDVQLSVATFVEEYEKIEAPEKVITYGEIVKTKEKETPTLTVQGLYHPMLQPQSTVKNDIALGEGKEVERFNIITGANMAGKSTYILSTGIIAMIYQRFGFSFSKEHRQSVFRKIVTYVNPTQDLALGLSLGEAGMEVLKRHNEVLKSCRGPFLVITDEIFRGCEVKTATRHSKQIITKWYKEHPNLLFLLTTHLRELTKLAGDYSGIANKKAIVNIPGPNGEPFEKTFKIAYGIGKEDIVHDVLEEKGIL